MADWDNNWNDDFNNGYSNNDNGFSHDNDNEDDALKNLFNDDSSEEAEQETEPASKPEVTASEEVVDEEQLFDIPRNAGTDKVFSEKEIFQVVNLLSLFGQLNENQSNLVNTLFGLQASMNIVRKAIKIVEADKKERDNILATVNALASLRKLSMGDYGDDNPIRAALKASNMVSDMDDDTRAGMIKFMTMIIADTSTSKKRMKSNKSASASAVVDEVIDVFSTDEEANSEFGELVEILEALESVVQ